MTAIIIDDELQSHQVLKSLLSKHHPDIKVLASGFSVEEGYQLINEHQPELVFLDIEMPDGTGFDLLRKIGGHNFQVIFITAFNQYAITAIRFGAIDYLLKPISKEPLSESIQRLYNKLAENVSRDQLEILFETFHKLVEKKLPSRIAIPTSKGIYFKLVKDIVRFEAMQNYTSIIFKDSSDRGFKKIVASINLGEYEMQFDPYRIFSRVHRSHMINVKCIGKWVKADGGYLVMIDGARIPISRSRRDDLNDLLGDL